MNNSDISILSYLLLGYKGSGRSRSWCHNSRIRSEYFELRKIQLINDILWTESKKIDDFDDYMFRLRPESNTRNPWFREYWHKLTGCPLNAQNNMKETNSRHCGKVGIFFFSTFCTFNHLFFK